MDPNKLTHNNMSDEEIKKRLKEIASSDELLQAMVDMTKHKDAQRSLRINDKKRKARADRKKSKKSKKR